MVARRRQHARDHAALLGHAHALLGAERFDIPGFGLGHERPPWRFDSIISEDSDQMSVTGSRTTWENFTTIWWPTTDPRSWQVAAQHQRGGILAGRIRIIAFAPAGFAESGALIKRAR